VATHKFSRYTPNNGKKPDCTKHELFRFYLALTQANTAFYRRKQVLSGPKHCKFALILLKKPAAIWLSNTLGCDNRGKKSRQENC